MIYCVKSFFQIYEKSSCVLFLVYWICDFFFFDTSNASDIALLDYEFIQPIIQGFL